MRNTTAKKLSSKNKSLAEIQEKKFTVEESGKYGKTSLRELQETSPKQY